MVKGQKWHLEISSRDIEEELQYDSYFSFFPFPLTFQGEGTAGKCIFPSLRATAKRERNKQDFNMIKTEPRAFLPPLKGCHHPLKSSHWMNVGQPLETQPVKSWFPSIREYVPGTRETLCPRHEGDTMSQARGKH